MNYKFKSTKEPRVAILLFQNYLYLWIRIVRITVFTVYDTYNGIIHNLRQLAAYNLNNNTIFRNFLFQTFPKSFPFVGKLFHRKKYNLPFFFKSLQIFKVKKKEIIL